MATKSSKKEVSVKQKNYRLPLEANNVILPSNPKHAYSKAKHINQLNRFRDRIHAISASASVAISFACSKLARRRYPAASRRLSKASAVHATNAVSICTTIFLHRTTDFCFFCSSCTNGLECDDATHGWWQERLWSERRFLSRRTDN